jgi:hypothetical protein
MIRAALALAEKGMRVFPCAVRGKTPATPNGCKDATAVAELIRSWWEHEPQYNIGLACGAPSSVFAIDIDGLDAECELRKLETEHGELPPTVEVITGRGRHIYFRISEVPVRNSAGKIAPRIDVRGDGGYTIMPPSVHPSGAKYCWSVDSAGAFAAAPEWLLSKIAAPTNGVATPPSAWRALVHAGVGEGARDCTITKLAGYLLRRYIDPVVALELLQTWNEARCTPPLPDEDVERIVNSIAGKELRRRGGA